MQPLVYIIVLNWNGYRDTMRCIASLERQRYENCRILVVDNGSTDQSVEALRRLGDRIILHENPDNRGYTGGNNRAMHTAFVQGADYVWLFNNDAVTEPDTLARLVEVCEADPGIGLASPLVREANGHGSVQFACGLFDLSTPSYIPCFEVQQAREWLEQFPRRIALSGTAMLVRRSVYEKTGILDDRLFAYWEDIEYSIRSAAAGFRNVLIPEASIFHEPKPTIASPGAIKPHFYYFMSRNEILMWRSLCRGTSFHRSVLWVLRRQLRQIQRMPDSTAGVDAVLAGLWDGCRGVGGAYDPNRRMPAPLRRLLGRHPAFWLRLMDGRR